MVVAVLFTLQPPVPEADEACISLSKINRPSFTIDAIPTLYLFTIGYMQS